jgi:hypothetical protein
LERREDGFHRFYCSVLVNKALFFVTFIYSLITLALCLLCPFVCDGVSKHLREPYGLWHTQEAENKLFILILRLYRWKEEKYDQNGWVEKAR